MLFSLDQIAGKSEGHINYQIVSFIFLMTWVLYFFSRENLKFKIFSLFIVAFLLFSSGGRSEFFGFIFAFGHLTFLSLLKCKIDLKKTTLVFLILLVIAVFMITIDLGDLFMSFKRVRHFEIGDLSSSTSWIARENIKHQNINYIYNSPFLGDFGSHFELAKGAYIHNVLSVWQQYGVFMFFIYLLLVLIPFAHLTHKKIVSSSSNPVLDVGLFFASYSLLLVCITKSVFWPYIGMSIGVYLYFCFNPLNQDSSYVQ